MPNNFYTSCVQYGNRILWRGVSNGQRVESRDYFRPVLYVRTNKPTKFYSPKGEPLEPIQFDDINAAKAFVNTYEGVSNFDIYGNTWYQFQYIAEKYPNEVDFDSKLIRIFGLDVETETEHGFPDVETTEERILLITVQNFHTKEITTFGWKDFDPASVTHFDASKFTYIKKRNEQEMLEAFLLFWKKSGPDVVTGWHIRFFDLPYLVNRIRKIMPEGAENVLSPWGVVYDHDVIESGQKHQVWELIGISTLDYLELYKKFILKKQESYKLDYIVSVELGKNKLENPYETFKEFYTNDWSLFVQYNVIDTTLITDLEDKMGLLEQIFRMAYRAKCNYGDAFSPVRLWDTIIYNDLKDVDVVLPQKKDKSSEDFVGAYVKAPTPGRYNWVITEDATSMYPKAILQYNMSPETLYQKRIVELPEMSDEEIQQALENDQKNPRESRMVYGFMTKEYDLSGAVEKNLAVAINGYGFSREKQGYFPALVERMFNERASYKKKQLEAEQQYERTKDLVYKDDAKRFKIIQESIKITLNSLYGAMGNKYFRFYDVRIAEAITMTGQYIIRQVSTKVNDYLNAICGTTAQEYVFYNDTDSLYITLEALVKKFFPDEESAAIVNLLDQICQEKLGLVIANACLDMARYTNAFENTTEFKRELIADTAIFVDAKKRYALSVWDAEGVRYDTPKIKITGMQSNSSATPGHVREQFKKAVEICLIGTEEEVQRFIAEYEQTFYQLPPEAIGFPKPVNGLLKYADDQTIYRKGTPMQVKAALLHNRAIEELGLTKKYELIKEGDRIKVIYLKEPNPIKNKVVGFVRALPKELALHQHIDYETMFDKTFLDPIIKVLDAIRWTPKMVQII